MSQPLPDAIRFEIDCWLEHRGYSREEWKAELHTRQGRSNARIWKLGCLGLLTKESNELPRKSTLRSDPLGFAIRCWSRPIEERQAIEKILFFQRAAHHACVANNENLQIIHEPTGVASIVPEMIPWTDGNWIRESDSALWTIESWRPGTSLDPADIVADELLSQSVSVVRQLHVAGKQLGVQRMVAPGVIERANRLAQWCPRSKRSEWEQRLDNSKNCFSKILPLEYARTSLNKILEHSDRTHQLLARRLQKWISNSVDCHWIVRDLWRENVLVEKNQISGVIDFGAARIDWPVLEIVRLYSSWLQPDDPRIAETLRALGSISEEDFRELDHLATLLSLFQWFDWILKAQVSLGGKSQNVQSRIEELIVRLRFYD
ncbi:MAG: phosphotransferase [Pirellulaceae bacterium]|nr:phosphotransferase [Pirellulaceae bacterium]